MSDCRVLGGRFQGPGTSCGGHYTKPVMYQSEDEDDWYDDSYYDPQHGYRAGLSKAGLKIGLSGCF